MSGGVERQLLVWRADSQRCVGQLAGHGASVVGVHCDDSTRQVLSLATDGVLRVWDLQTHRCLQTLEPLRVRPTAMLYDAERKQLIAGR